MIEINYEKKNDEKRRLIIKIRNIDEKKIIINYNRLKNKLIIRYENCVFILIKKRRKRKKKFRIEFRLFDSLNKFKNFKKLTKTLLTKQRFAFKVNHVNKIKIENDCCKKQKFVIFEEKN